MKDLAERINSDRPDCMLSKIEDARGFADNIYRFAVEAYWHSNASINVFDVKGSCHYSYIDNDWLYIINSGRRIQQNLKLLAENPAYYLTDSVKHPSMYYSRHNGSVYLREDGNHRTAIAKAYFYYAGHETLQGVDLIDYAVDFQMMEAFDRLLEIIESRFSTMLNAVVSRQNIGRDDGQGWHKDMYNLKIQLRNLSNGKTMLLNSTEVFELIHELQSNPYLRMFRSNKYAKFLR